MHTAAAATASSPAAAPQWPAWAVTLEEEVERLNENARLFLEINMGATAIGTRAGSPCIRYEAMTAVTLIM